MSPKDTHNDTGSGGLPGWNLDDLFPGKESKELKDAIAKIDRDTEAFSKKYKGEIAKLSGDALGDAIAEYEKIYELIGRVSAYASLRVATDASESSWQQTLSEQMKPATARLLFFRQEINKMDEADILDRITSEKLAAYAPWLRNVRGGRDHMLDEKLEEFIHDKSGTGAAAWQRLHAMTMVDLRFNLRGKEMTQTEILGVINGSDDRALRQEAYREFGRVLGEKKDLFAMITNTLADIKRVDDEWRNYDGPAAARHRANQIEPEVVDAMVKAVKDAYPNISHKYYAWKAKKMGETRLHPADRNAPLPGAKKKDVTWEEARDTVLSAYRGFSPEMADTAQKFFDNNWIDAPPRKGKRGGAFSSSTVPSVHPYVLVNFQGSSRDLKTLAHELGHGVHQTLAGREQGLLKASTPLTLAETASVFGEMLTFREMLDNETDPAVKRTLIAEKIEDMLNTVVRQTAFYEFERKVHTERRDKGELKPERIAEIWQETQKESLGPAIDLDVDGSEHLWSYIPHFIRTPFYVYAYAFGECLVNALYSAYEDAEDKQAFSEKYLDMLRAGGTKRHRDALAPFGLDATDPEFWKKGLSVIENYIDELIALDAEIEQQAKLKQHFGDTVKPKEPPPANDKPGEDFNAASKKDAKPANDDAPVLDDPRRHRKKGPKHGG